jgi:3-oxoacyl-(acyl-carrier-protein) synthase
MYKRLYQQHAAPGAELHVVPTPAALLDKWRSEERSWGRLTSLVGARIGWVRGTGLMDANDLVAARLEADTGLRTFAADEMALLLTGLISDEARAAAAHEPLIARLTGGMERLDDLAERVASIRGELQQASARARRRAELDERLRQALGGTPTAPVLVAPTARVVVDPPVPTPEELATLPPLDHLDPTKVVAVVGFGEVSPWGSARTRWAIERSGELSLEAVAELAWIIGLIKPNVGPTAGSPGVGWIDVETGTPIDDLAIKAKYEARVLGAAGIRFIAPGAHGFDPNGALGLVDVHLDRDCAFAVPTREVAESLRGADPEHTRVIAETDGAFTVVRQRGAVIKVARALRLDRQIGGQIPDGWDATRYGVSRELAEQVDRVTLFNLVATVEAFGAAGLEPEELYAYLHPSRVGITQASGIGGMQKLKRMYQDFALGHERQNDALQETLINVMTGYVVQTYLGSYGPMSFPVAACATAALSLASGVEKIITGSADFVVTGGADDFREEGLIGFADMGATCSSDDMLRLGIAPERICRPNDRRRRGFVEAQGAGALLLCRASLAMRAGLPVYGVVAYAGSFGDGINQSVPAPGLGILAATAETGAPRDGGTACGFAERRAAIAAVLARRDDLARTLGADAADELVRAARRRHAHEFQVDRADISPLRGALGVFGLTADDIAVVSKHDTSTAANDLNENRLHTWLQEKLGRTPALPLVVISQKSLTGHPKGAAAAWQMNGLLQAMADGIVPGNRSLDDVDPAMREFVPLTFSDAPIPVGRLGLRAGLVTSLGFGHVGAIVCLLHPFFFWRMLGEPERADYAARMRARTRRASQRLQAAVGGHASMYVRRSERPFVGREGSLAHLRHEAESLTDASVRLDPLSGRYAPARERRVEERPS